MAGFFYEKGRSPADLENKKMARSKSLQTFCAFLWVVVQYYVALERKGSSPQLGPKKISRT
jgi:hypothetical protein